MSCGHAGFAAREGRADSKLKEKRKHENAYEQEQGTKHRFNTLKQSMVEHAGGTFPRMKGKAAEIRYIGRPLLSVFEDLMDSGTQAHRTLWGKLPLGHSTRALYSLWHGTRGRYHIHMGACVAI